MKYFLHFYYSSVMEPKYRSLNYRKVILRRQFLLYFTQILALFGFLAGHVGARPSFRIGRAIWPSCRIIFILTGLTAFGGFPAAASGLLRALCVVIGVTHLRTAVSVPATSLPVRRKRPTFRFFSSYKLILICETYIRAVSEAKREKDYAYDLPKATLRISGRLPACCPTKDHSSPYDLYYPHCWE